MSFWQKGNVEEAGIEVEEECIGGVLMRDTHRGAQGVGAESVHCDAAETIHL